MATPTTPSEELAICLSILESPPLSPKDIEMLIEGLTELRDWLKKLDEWLSLQQISLPERLETLPAESHIPPTLNEPADPAFLHELETARFKANLPK